MDFGLLSEIAPQKLSTFKKNFLTFDIDWASDEVLEYCLDIIEEAAIKATWFVTHQTPLLERLRANPLFELGIHPNFNLLLEGDFTYGRNYCEVLKYFLDIVPEAKVIRSHCLGVSSKILYQAKQLGITHESNTLVPAMALDTSAGGGYYIPYNNWDGLVCCPYHWADDVACMYENKVNLNLLGAENNYFVISFHPIHLFLNTESLSRYQQAKSFYKDYKRLKEYRGNSPYGSLEILKNLLKRNVNG